MDQKTMKRSKRADFKSYFSDIATITPVNQSEEYLKLVFSEYTIQSDNYHMQPEDVACVTMPRSVAKQFAELLLKHSADSEE